VIWADFTPQGEKEESNMANLTININGIEHPIYNNTGSTEIALPDLAEDDCWREHATEFVDNDIDSCYRYDLGNGNSLYIDCEQGAPSCLSIDTDSMIEHLRDWWSNTNDGMVEFAEWLAGWGLDGLAVLTKANEGDEGPFRVWHEPHYPGTCNAPQPGFAHKYSTDDEVVNPDQDEGIWEFATYEQAAAYVHEYYNEPSTYDGIPQCNVLSHGQAGADRLTIVRTDD